MKHLTILVGLLLTLPSWAQIVNPPNQSQTSSTQPAISANFGTPVRNARIWVDGTEFTQHLRSDGQTVTLVPPYNLDYGVHQVQVTGNNGLQANWSFAITHNGPAAYPVPYNGGYYPSNSGTQVLWPNNGYYENNNGGYHPNSNYNPAYRNRVIDVRSYSPPNNTVVTVPKPTVAVAFSGTVQNLKLTVDGRDVTRESRAGNEGISWVPDGYLRAGRHTARVTGTASNGQAVSGEWSFEVRY